MYSGAALDSGFGTWAPLVWVAAFLLALTVGYVIRSFGKSDYKKDSEQTKPFLSGNEEPDENLIHVRGSNLYWGYLEALKGYYEKLTALHTGSMADYLLWFFGVMAIMVLLGLCL